jgi:predicted transcriptional regulator
MYQTEIGERLGVTQATVSRDLKALHGEWLQSALRDVDDAKAEELAKIDRLEREYWEQWENSKTNREGETKGAGMSYGAGIERCIERRCKILGIEAPKHIDLTSQGDKILGPTIVNLPAQEED